MGVPELLPRPALVAIGVAVAVLSAAGLAATSELILANATTSVPRGLYRRAAPETATYVSFCLGARHAAGEWYRHFCSPDDPDGVRILKRVGEKLDGGIMVEGDGARPLDSHVLGPVRHDEIRGWWRPVIQVGRHDGG